MARFVSLGRSIEEDQTARSVRALASKASGPGGVGCDRTRDATDFHQDRTGPAHISVGRDDVNGPVSAHLAATQPISVCEGRTRRVSVFSDRLETIIPTRFHPTTASAGSHIRTRTASRTFHAIPKPSGHCYGYESPLPTYLLPSHLRRPPRPLLRGAHLPPIPFAVLRARRSLPPPPASRRSRPRRASARVSPRFPSRAAHRRASSRD